MPSRRSPRRWRVTLRVGPHVARFDAKGGVGETRPVEKLLSKQMPSRQERRQAERDAAKRAPGRAGAAGGAGAAAAGANMNPLGDWTTQAKDPYVGPGG